MKYFLIAINSSIYRGERGLTFPRRQVLRAKNFFQYIDTYSAFSKKWTGGFCSQKKGRPRKTPNYVTGYKLVYFVFITLAADVWLLSWLLFYFRCSKKYFIPVGRRGLFLRNNSNFRKFTIINYQIIVTFWQKM